MPEKTKLLGVILPAVLPTAIDLVKNQIAKRENKPAASVKIEEIDYDELARAIQSQSKEKAKSDPVLSNATNNESVLRSRVVVGTSTGIFGAVIILIQHTIGIPFAEWDWNVIGPAIVIVWGGTEALRGRLTTGLKPLFSRWLD